jgi:hypothetical protein
MPTACRFTAWGKSTGGKASTSTAWRSPTGAVVPHGIFAQPINGCLIT